MTSAFSSDGTAVIERTMSLHTGTRSMDVLSDYDVEGCSRWIIARGYRKVALQFPDELLADAAAVAMQLNARIDSSQAFVLADTSYGSCCVDEVTAQHGHADCLIHYGAACLTPAVGRLPVRYVFQNLPLDLNDCVSAVRSAVQDAADYPIVLLYDTEFAHVSEALTEALGCHFKTVVRSHLVVAEPGSNCPDVNAAASAGGSSAAGCDVDVTLLSRRFQLPGSAAAAADETSAAPDGGALSRCALLVITRNDDGGALLEGVLLRLGSAVTAVYSYCPSTNICRCEAGAGSLASAGGRLPLNRRLAKRYHAIEKAKDARIVGILAGTLGVSGYLDAIGRLKELLRKAGKKSYTFVVGKLNPAKLANFPEVDVFVLVACPQNSLLDATDFYRPIVTPYEMEMACNPARVWDRRYAIDFRSLLPGGESHVPLPDALDEVADVSLLTGAVRRIGTSSSPTEDDGSADGDRDSSQSKAVAKRPSPGDMTVSSRENDGSLAVRSAPATTAGKQSSSESAHLILKAKHAAAPTCTDVTPDPSAISGRLHARELLFIFRFPSRRVLAAAKLAGFRAATRADGGGEGGRGAARYSGWVRRRRRRKHCRWHHRLITIAALL